MLQAIETLFTYGQHTVSLQTGEIARQATGAVRLQMGDTVILATVVADKSVKEGQDFFPLTVNYQEKTYAAGKIPGGYLKREGRPSEKETLISRLIDRPIRPLFPQGFYNEVQVVITVMSLDPEVGTEVASILAASAALMVSGVPFKGPVGAAKVGYLEGEYCLNPSPEMLKTSQLDLSVAGTRDAVLMVESEAQLLSEEVMLGAVVFGHHQMQVAIDAIQSFAAKAGKASWDWSAAQEDTALRQAIETACLTQLGDAYRITEKQARYARVDAIREGVVAQLCPVDAPAPQWSEKAVEKAFHDAESRIVRERILANEPRIDGRDLKTIRPISVKTGVLPRVHGSALFTRGETQAIVVATLGTDKEAQIIDDIEGEFKDRFMFHYNFPPYSVGEVGRMGSPGRREIGHGRLAKRGVAAVVPDADVYPYTLRVVSEITESNGSSSMASVCGSSLALMDAGVPLVAPVAGIAMGLVKEGDRFAVISDILGDEDHLGDMDFKVAGSAEGITALQMDIKIEGITPEIMKIALEQAKAGRLHILGIMNACLDKPRDEPSPFAPRFTKFSINPNKIGAVIGKGGATIKDIIAKSGCQIDISETGEVTLASTGSQSAEIAREMIMALTADVEVGKTYTGKVVRIVEFGAFVELMPGKDGLLHISQISQQRVNKVEDFLSEGQVVTVLVQEVDRQGKIKLTMKEIAQG